ncbi:hypothetical protein B0T24DRAFT_712107 [Lasiosphaeria ovina]|uniref:Uncharacterized protein n=1 Tax=Lasiosphaeria ovina TaxID=92902 RepID=A0AAE0MZP9_9PEZI|nr:hypothetical protein B0T24DRAFT_712107 [Lasiosphaeria ovina]
MQSKGLWAFKYGDKYYTFASPTSWDSDALGTTLTLMIPRNHIELREWLAATRRDLAALAQRCEQAWTVSLDSATGSKAVCAIAGAEHLALSPGHIRPDRGLCSSEGVYVLDLDRETLAHNNICHFYLETLPDEPAHPCITSDEAPLPPPIVDEQSVATKYMALESGPLAEHMIRLLDPSAEALVSAMEKVYQLACDMYDAAITQALHSCSAESHLFRELGYLLLSVASCSPDQVRLADADSDDSVNALHLPNDTHGAIQKLSSFKYGILSGRRRELVSSFLGGFHEDGKAPGCSPPDTSYWIGPVAAVDSGRAEKQEFGAVVFSLRHFVLISVSPQGVEHSKRYYLMTRSSHIPSPCGDDHVTCLEEHLDLLNHGDRGDRDWVAPKSCGGFRALAHFLLRTNFKYNHNRDVALEDFALTRALELVDQSTEDPKLLQIVDEETIQRDKLFTGLCRRWKGPDRNHVRHVLVVRAGSKASTPSFMAVPVPWEPTSSARQKLTTALELDSAPEFPACTIPGRLKKHFLGKLKRYDSCWRNSLARAGTNWDHLDALLTSRDGPLISSYVISLAVLYGLVFFVPSGIVGCGVDPTIYSSDLRKVHRGQLARQSLESHVQMAGRAWTGGREQRRRTSIYLVALYGPASDDSVTGWARAQKEARKQAELEYIREAFLLWIEGEDTAMHDLAVFVIVGTNLDLEDFGHEGPLERPWKGTSISAKDMRAQLRLGPVDAMARRGQKRARDEDPDPEKMQPPPFDTRDKTDRRAIEAALTWTRTLAVSRGNQHSERFVAPHPYPI